MNLSEAFEEWADESLKIAEEQFDVARKSWPDDYGDERPTSDGTVDGT